MKKVLTPEEKAAASRIRNAKRYGLSLFGYDLMIGDSPKCNICGRIPKPGKSLYTDHDHKTGAVRGRLCFTCNYRLLGRGALGTAALHRAAAEYLERGVDWRNIR